MVNPCNDSIILIKENKFLLFMIKWKACTLENYEQPIIEGEMILYQ